MTQSLDVNAIQSSTYGWLSFDKIVLSIRIEEIDLRAITLALDISFKANI